MRPGERKRRIYEGRDRSIGTQKHTHRERMREESWKDVQKSHKYRVTIRKKVKKSKKLRKYF